MDDRSPSSYELPFSGLVVESRGREIGSPWRLIDPLMSADELAALAWEIPADRLVVSRRGGHLQSPHPQSGRSWMSLIGDSAAEPVAVTWPEPDGDRHAEVVQFGGAWVAEWLGPFANCVVSRAGQQESVPFDRRVLREPLAPTGLGWVGPGRPGPKRR